MTYNGCVLGLNLVQGTDTPWMDVNWYQRKEETSVYCLPAFCHFQGDSLRLRIDIMMMCNRRLSYLKRDRIFLVP